MNLGDKKLAYHRKSNGTVYVYEIVERYWDKAKQQARNRQVCIGRLDPVTGAFIPSKRLDSHLRKTLSQKTISPAKTGGPILVLDSVTRSLGLLPYLKEMAPEDFRSIFYLSYYMISTGKSLRQAPAWFRKHQLPFPGALNWDSIQELLARIDPQAIDEFFKRWTRARGRGEILCYDAGLRPDGNLPWLHGCGNMTSGPEAQVMLYTREGLLPLAYQNLPDQAGRSQAVGELLEKLIGPVTARPHLILDEGFYSEAAFDRLLESRAHFTLGLSVNVPWVEAFLEEHRAELDSPLNIREIEGYPVYVTSRPHQGHTGRRRLYIHLYYDAHRTLERKGAFDLELMAWKRELETGQTKPEHEACYQTFFEVRRTPKRGIKVLMREDAIQSMRARYSGYKVLLSTRFKDSAEALRSYRQRTIINQFFDEMNSQLDLDMTPIQELPIRQGKSFLHFLTLVLLSGIRAVQAQAPATLPESARDLLREMESLSALYSPQAGGLKLQPGQATEVQEAILDAFGVSFTKNSD